MAVSIIRPVERDENEVLIESLIKDALIVKSWNSANPELAEEVIHKLRTILISVNEVGLVKANKEFYGWQVKRLCHSVKIMNMSLCV